MSSLMFSRCYPEVSLSFQAVIAFFVNGLRTDRRTDPRTDKASYRDAWTHLKMCTLAETYKIFHPRGQHP